MMVNVFANSTKERVGYLQWAGTCWSGMVGRGHHGRSVRTSLRWEALRLKLALNLVKLAHGK